MKYIFSFFFLILISPNTYLLAGTKTLLNPKTKTFDFTFNNINKKSSTFKTSKIVDKVPYEVDSVLSLLPRHFNIKNCPSDTYGNIYCPEALSPASSTWSYVDGQVFERKNSVIDYEQGNYKELTSTVRDFMDGTAKSHSNTVTDSQQGTSTPHQGTVIDYTKGTVKINTSTVEDFQSNSISIKHTGTVVDYTSKAGSSNIAPTVEKVAQWYKVDYISFDFSAPVGWINDGYYQYSTQDKVTFYSPGNEKCSILDNKTSETKEYNIGEKHKFLFHINHNGPHYTYINFECRLKEEKKSCPSGYILNTNETKCLKQETPEIELVLQEKKVDGYVIFGVDEGYDWKNVDELLYRSEMIQPAGENGDPVYDRYYFRVFDGQLQQKLVASFILGRTDPSYDWKNIDEILYNRPQVYDGGENGEPKFDEYYFRVIGKAVCPEGYILNQEKTQCLKLEPTIKKYSEPKEKTVVRRIKESVHGGWEPVVTTLYDKDWHDVETQTVDIPSRYDKIFIMDNIIAMPRLTVRSQYAVSEYKNDYSGSFMITEEHNGQSYNTFYKFENNKAYVRRWNGGTSCDNNGESCSTVYYFDRDWIDIGLTTIDLPTSYDVLHVVDDLKKVNIYNPETYPLSDYKKDFTGAIVLNGNDGVKTYYRYRDGKLYIRRIQDASGCDNNGESCTNKYLFDKDWRELSSNITTIKEEEKRFIGGSDTNNKIYIVDDVLNPPRPLTTYTFAEYNADYSNSFEQSPPKPDILQNPYTHIRTFFKVVNYCTDGVLENGQCAIPTCKENGTKVTVDNKEYCTYTGAEAKCPSGYMEDGERCKKDITFDFYSYGCPVGYTPVNHGFTTYTKIDPDETIVNEYTLDDAVNSQAPPEENCKKPITYKFFEYGCPSDYTPNETGLKTCDKTDPNRTTDDSTSLSEDCNSSTPPVDNCGKEVPYQYYTYECPTNYTASDSGQLSCPKTDTDLNNDNSATLVEDCNSQAPPENNCSNEITYNFFEYECSEGYTVIDPGLTACPKTDSDGNTDNSQELAQNCNEPIAPPENCFKDIEYKHYTYGCSEGYITDNYGLETCPKTDPDRSKNSSDLLDDSCNSATPPEGNCRKEIIYSLYEYQCEATNEFGENYVAQDEGLKECEKIDTDKNAVNEDTLSQDCNSNVVPQNNCKAEAYTCNSNKVVPAFVNGQWQCSALPCNNDNKCGTAKCLEFEPSTQYYMPNGMKPIKPKYDGDCKGVLCDAVNNSKITYCETEGCPSEEGIYEKNGGCYYDDCPLGSTLNSNDECEVIQ